MPNKGTHIAAGAGLGAAVLSIWEIIDQNQKIQRGEQTEMDWGGVAVNGFIGAVVGGAFGVLPDVFEPATCFEHRQFFHSLTFAIAAAGGIHQLMKRIQNPMVRRVVIAAAVGYGSHLGLDAQTPSRTTRRLNMELTMTTEVNHTPRAGTAVMADVSCARAACEFGGLAFSALPVREFTELMGGKSAIG